MTYRYFGSMVALTLLVGAGAGCAYFSTEASVKTAVSRFGKPGTAGRVAVPYFMFDKYKSGAGAKSWQDSAITDRFATGLLKQGYRVVDRAHVRQVLNENNMTPADLFNEDNVQRIGALLGADTVVLGRLTLVEQADGHILERKLNVRAIRVFDGVVVFSVSSIDTTPYRILTGEDLADQALADMLTPQGSQKNGVPSSSSLAGGNHASGGTASTGAARMDTSTKMTGASGLTSDKESSETRGEALDESRVDGLHGSFESADEPAPPPTESATLGQ